MREMDEINPFQKRKTFSWKLGANQRRGDFLS